MDPIKKKKKNQNTPGPFRQQQVDKVGEAYKRQGIDVSNFPNFNQATDTIIQGQSNSPSFARRVQSATALSGGYTHAQSEITVRYPNGLYSNQKLYKKK